ncbi:MAG: hypothetical protein V3V61_04050 [Gammaproteobacteria bacterium]
MSLFDGDSNTYGVDFIWKWAPNGNAYRNYATLQAEYFYRFERGKVAISDALQNISTYTGRQQGWYAQTIYQFMPRWRVSLRYATVATMPLYCKKRG